MRKILVSINAVFKNYGREDIYICLMKPDSLISKRHILIKTAEQSRHMLSRMRMQNRASKIDKMKFIDHAMISFMEDTTSSKMTDQIDDFIAKASCRFF